MQLLRRYSNRVLSVLMLLLGVTLLWLLLSHDAVGWIVTPPSWLPPVILAASLIIGLPSAHQLSIKGGNLIYFYWIAAILLVSVGGGAMLIGPVWIGYPFLVLGTVAIIGEYVMLIKTRRRSIQTGVH